MRSQAKAATAIVCSLLVGSVLIVTSLTQRYATWLTRRLSQNVGSAKPWNWLVVVTPFAPLILLLAPHSFLGSLAFFVLGLAVVEVWAIGLQTSCWIAAYQPDLIPVSASPLGRPPLYAENRRLHWICRAHVTHAIVLVVVIAFTTLASPLSQQVLALLFAAKYVGYSGPDMEAVVHWDMHCRVLDTQGPRAVRIACRVALDFVVGPMNGYVPRIYDANHLLIHHRYNSGNGDIHSVSSYDRTSFLEFSLFAVKMCGSVMFGTDLFPHQLCRGRVRRLAMVGVSCFWFAVIVAAYSRSLLAPVLVAFAVIHGVRMAQDQWVWHGLVIGDSGSSPVGTTVLWVASHNQWNDFVVNGLRGAPVDDADASPSPQTAWAFYDNLHLLHHLHSSALYTVYPALLRRELDRLVASRASVLEWSIYDEFCNLCWTRQFDRIAAALVNPVSDSPIELIRTRLSPDVAERTPWAVALGGSISQAADRVLPRLLATLRV